MRNPDLAIYLAHAAFYSVFSVRAFRRIKSRRATARSEVRPRASEGRTASFSRVLIVFHGFGFAVLYAGIGSAVIPRRVPNWTTYRRKRGDLDWCVTRGMIASFL